MSLCEGCEWLHGGCHLGPVTAPVLSQMTQCSILHMPICLYWDTFYSSGQWLCTVATMPTWPTHYKHVHR